VELTSFDRQAIFVGSEIDHDLAFAAATGYRATLDTRLDVTLVANYPNPFNSTTTITFAFGAEDRVSLAIYDVGRRVRTLVRKTLPPGQHSIRWGQPPPWPWKKVGGSPSTHRRCGQISRPRLAA
jgi:hypothetical protein